MGGVRADQPRQRRTQERAVDHRRVEPAGALSPWLALPLLALAFLTAPVVWLFGDLDPWVLLCWLTAPIAVRLVRTVRERTDGPSLNSALAGTGMLQLLFCTLLAAGILAS